MAWYAWYRDLGQVYKSDIGTTITPVLPAENAKALFKKKELFKEINN